MRFATTLLVALAGCSSLDQFDIELSAEATLPGTASQLQGPTFPRFPGGAEISRSIENQGVSPEDVQSTRLTKGTLRVVAPDGETLRYLKGFELYVEAEGLDRQRIASVSEASLQGAPARVELVPDDVELQPYVTAPEMKLVPQVEPSGERPFTDVTLSVDLTLFVDLTLVD